MKNKLIAGVLVLGVSAVLSGPQVWAKSEDKGGKGGLGKSSEKALIKPQDRHQDQMREKVREHRPGDDERERAESHKRQQEREQEHRDDSDASGLAKQRERKITQEQKELGKGSEQGQQMREEHSRKWWKFWE